MQFVRYHHLTYIWSIDNEVVTTFVGSIYNALQQECTKRSAEQDWLNRQPPERKKIIQLL